MPKAKEVEPNVENVPNKSGADFVTDEMREVAEAHAAQVRSRNKEVTSGVGVRRRTGGGAVRRNVEPSDIPYPQDAHGEDFEFYSPAGAAAVIPDDVEVAAYSLDQEFIVDPDMVRTFSFDKPGRNLPKKRLYTIKALHKDGRLVQLPFEAQIQNNAGGDPEDAIGLRRYQRKGLTLLVDWDTLTPLYCAAWDCWAQAQNETNHAGFCSLRHAKHTLPNRFRGGEEGQIQQGLFSEGVTTQNVWNS